MNTDNVLTIRQMCDAFGVTPRTLRFYEQKELLAPRREGQKRLFTRRDRARLKLILRGKRFGFSLEDIRQLLDLYGIDDAQETQMLRTYEIAQERLSDLKTRRIELDEAIADLERQMAWGERAQNRYRGVRQHDRHGHGQHPFVGDGPGRTGGGVSHPRALAASGSGPWPVRTGGRDCPARPRFVLTHSAAPIG